MREKKNNPVHRARKYSNLPKHLEKLKANGDTAKARTCLKCNKVFSSLGSRNRICDNCKKTQYRIMEDHNHKTHRIIV
tara:strand:+ start:806 stop:1039 length:234 start_codon:yes stop_codon:yes gene_type:complete